MAVADRFWAPESPAYDAFFNTARGDNVKELERVLTPEIDINALQGDGFEGQAALHLAASRGDIGMVKALLARGADINLFDQALEGGSQPLHLAAFGAHTDTVKLLLDSGAERDEKGLLEEKALFQVLLHKLRVTPKHVETITLLLDYGFDVNNADVVSVDPHSKLEISTHGAIARPSCMSGPLAVSSAVARSRRLPKSYSS